MAGALLLAVFGSVPLAMGARQPSLNGHVPEAVRRLHLQPLGRLPATNELNLAICLPLRNTNELAHLLQDIYNPASPRFRQYLSPQQFTTQFGPEETDYQALIDFAQKHGLQLTRHPNRVVLDVAGSVAAIEQMFHVKLYVYQHPKEPRTFYAPDAQPSVEGSLSIPILSIDGLDNYALPHPVGLHLMPAEQPGGPQPELGGGPGGAYLGKDFRAAYVPGTRLDGTGQSVALVEFDNYYPNDITAYENLARLPHLSLTNILVDGGFGTPGPWNSEVSLDIEMVIAMATNVANVLVYEAPNSGSANWLDLLSQIADDNLAAQIGCSWGIGIQPIPGAEQIFQKMAAQGQSFFSAAGDQLAYVDFVAAPADSPSITQVGGTSLNTAGPGGARISETVWNQGLDTGNDNNKGEYLGTGGGISPNFPIPSWQLGVNSFLTNGGSLTARNAPDVALTAQNVYVKYGNGAGSTFGGTSCAAPLWAGFMALVNQQAASTAPQARVGFINPAIYEIANESIYNDCFNDIVTGSNTWPASPHAFYAVPGYDLCTGLGTPKGTNLINALVSPDPLVVTPNGGFGAAKSPAGTFNLISQTYYLTNAGTASLDWNLMNTSAWLNISSGSGTLAAGADDSVTISLNTVASNLAVGTYSASIWFTNITSGVGHSRFFTLTVSDPLVIQSQMLWFHGPSGGPFTPDQQTLLLTNPSATTLNWGTLSTSIWFNVSPSSGSLAPGGQTNVAFTTSPAATNLADGFYTNSIQLTNLTSQYVQPVTAVLSVAIVQNGGFETGDFSDWTLVGNGVTPDFIYNAVVDANYGGNDNNWGALCVHSGAFGACLGDTNIATLSQALPTVPGQEYLLSFWLDNQLSVAGEQFLVNWNTNSTSTNRIYYLNNPPALSWAKHAFVVTATETSTMLQFGAEAAPYAFGLDDVSVVAVFPPSLTSQPTNLTVLAGGTATFGATASGTAPLVYHWMDNGTNLVNGPGISGAASTNLTLSSISTNSAGDYALLVANAYGSITSSVATLTVVLPPTFVSVAANPNGSLTLQLGGSPGVMYILESKSDLASIDPWLPLATNVFDLTGFWQFTDLQTINFPEKYYRLKYTQ